jgi:hypothetical protein
MSEIRSNNLFAVQYTYVLSGLLWSCSDGMVDTEFAFYTLLPCNVLYVGGGGRLLTGGMKTEE